MTGEIEIIHGVQSMLSSDVAKQGAVFAARYLVFLFVPLLGVLGYGRKRLAWRRTAYDAATAALVVMVVANLIGMIIDRDRPYVASTDIVQLIPAPLTAHSFPSGHTSVAFACAAAIVLGHPALGLLAMVMAAIVGLGRVAVGVHYPSDIIAGALLGILCAIIVHFIRLRISKRV